MTRIYLFPGQGSQKAGMGADLFSRFPRQVTAANAELGSSIEDLCLRDPNQQLNLTQFTQPALYVVNALSYLALLERVAELPHFVAGHSLGEYNALFAAGVFDFVTGLKLVIERGRLMSQAGGGAMAAVIGLTPGDVERVLRENGFNSIDLANFNSPRQVVVSGPQSDILAAQAAFETAGAQLFKPLNVSAAFHSRYMAAARLEFERFLEPFEFRPPRLPVMANATARPYDATALKQTLAKQIDHSVRWTETVQYLLEQPEPKFVEVGPGNVLTGLLRRIEAGK